MSKQLQRYACVVLAVMMVWAVMPVLGVAESPTTPSDLPDVTAVPTEMPTEVPTEEPAEVPTEVPTDVPTELPTEVPVEGEPPVLVEDVEQPPMLMAAADDLAPFGLEAINNAAYEFTRDENGDVVHITLKSGDFNSGGIVASNQAIVIQKGAKLSINGEYNNFDSMRVSGCLDIPINNCGMYGRVVVERGGSFTDWENCRFDELYVDGATVSLKGSTTKMVVQNGANVTLYGSASAGELTATGSTITVESGGKVTGTATLTNCTITSTKGSYGELVLDNTKGDFDGGGNIKTLNVKSLPENGTLTTQTVPIGEVMLPRTVLEVLAAEYAGKVLSLVGGEMPPTATYPAEFCMVSIDYPGLQLHEFRSSDFVKFVYTPANEGRIPYDVTDWGYHVVCHLGGAATVNLAVVLPVAPGIREIVLSGGTIEKAYDGKADFEKARVTDPQWTLDGDSFTFDEGISIECKVTGAASSKDSGTYENQTCTSVEVNVIGAVPLPDDVVISTTGKVNMVITKKPVTISGTVYKNAGDYTIKMIDYIKQGNVVIDGLAEGDTVEQLDPNREMGAYDADGKYMTQITSYTKGESYQVVRLTETKNYLPQPVGLTMCIRKQGEATFTHGNFREDTGTWDAQMQVTSEDYDLNTVQIKYSLVNAQEPLWRDSFDEYLLGENRDTYWVSAVFPEQGPYEKRIITLEFRYIKIANYTFTIPASMEINNYVPSPNNPFAERTECEKWVSCSITGIDKLYLTITSQNGGKLTWDSAKKGTGAKLWIEGSDVKIPYAVYSIGSNYERATTSIYLTSRSTGFSLRCVVFNREINPMKDSLAGGTWTDVLTFSFSTTPPGTEP